MHTERPFVLSVAGYDPSGGAGLLADIKTFEQLKVQGLGICTAMTLQTASECLSLNWQPLEEILEAIEVLMKSSPVKAVKIGVIKNAEYLKKIVEKINEMNSKAKVVWDPVLKSSSDFSFFDLNTISDLKKIIDKIDLITPNYPEYQILREYMNETSSSVLIKGGHHQDNLGTDILVGKGTEISFQSNDKTSVFYPKHGSGCVLSSAIASFLAKGENLETACRKGKLYIENFLKSSESLLGFHSN